jgi:hypothetical protein
MTTTKKAATKGNRSENLNLRFNPRLKYLAGIQARNERRTLSNLIENAVEAYLARTGVTIGGKKTSLLDWSEPLWAINEAERFVRFATEFPFLLTFEEEHLWAIIQNRELTSPHSWDQLALIFDDLQKLAVERAAAAPIVSVGGFPFRGGKMDTSIPQILIETKTTKSKKSGKA